MERIYCVENPWRVDREVEQYRYREINRIIRDRIGEIGSILEVGSGEGHQTEWLLKLAPVHGIETSTQAVKRARRRVPHATFEIGALPALPDRRADLVTACELIYYLPDDRLAVAVAALERVAPRRIVSYFRDENAVRLDSVVLRIDGVEREDIRFEDSVWTIAWW
jgi:trans-aconitate methyltransferase